MVKLSWLLSKALGINWKLSCTSHSQDSGKVEGMNTTLKEILTKYTLETGGNWVDLLPYDLLRGQCTPYLEKFTPYELVYGQSPLMTPWVFAFSVGCYQTAPLQSLSL